MHKIVIGIISESKIEQALILEDTLSPLSIIANSTLFGEDEGIIKNIYSVYGSLLILIRYGMIGFILLTLFWIWLVDRSMFLLSFKQDSFQLYFLPMSVLVSCFISFRIPQINQIVPVILLTASLNLYPLYAGVAINRKP